VGLLFDDRRGPERLGYHLERGEPAPQAVAVRFRNPTASHDCDDISPLRAEAGRFSGERPA
jgi:hypothetical protein